MKFSAFLAGLSFLASTALHAQLTAYESGGKWGFKDSKGTVVVPAKYAGIGWNGLAIDLDGQVKDVFSEGLAPVTVQGAPTGLLNAIEGGKWGFVDASGKGGDTA